MTFTTLGASGSIENRARPIPLYLCYFPSGKRPGGSDVIYMGSEKREYVKYFTRGVISAHRERNSSGRFGLSRGQSAG